MSDKYLFLQSHIVVCLLGYKRASELICKHLSHMQGIHVVNVNPVLTLPAHPNRQPFEQFCAGAQRAYYRNNRLTVVTGFPETAEEASHFAHLSASIHFAPIYLDDSALEALGLRCSYDGYRKAEFISARKREMEGFQMIEQATFPSAFSIQWGATEDVRRRSFIQGLTNLVLSLRHTENFKGHLEHVVASLTGERSSLKKQGIDSVPSAVAVPA